MEIEQILDNLIKLFDEKIDQEKEQRSDYLKQSEDWHYTNGRVDGVDAGRYLVENYFYPLLKRT
jgi:hypothetical protein